MKYKSIMLFTFILLILTISAVNASENLNYDNSTQSINSFNLNEITSENVGYEIYDLTLVDSEDSNEGHVLDRELNNSEILTGSDDSIFQQKVADTPSGGVLVLDRTYNFDSFSIEIDKPITIDGAGHGLYTKSISDNYFMKVSADNVVLKNIIFTNMHSTKGIIAWSGVNGKLDSCTFSDNNIYGQTYFRAHILVGRDIQHSITWSGSNGTISNSKFLNNKGDPLIYLSALGINISNCDFKYDDNSHSIEISRYTKNCIINDCTFKSCNSSQGIIYNHANHTIIKNCKFSDNIGIVVYFNDDYIDYRVETNNNTSGCNSQIIGSIFVNNNGNIIVSNAKSCSMTNSIIFDYPNNKASLIYLKSTDYFNADYNWWGNTLNNKFIKPYYYSGVEVNHWLFLNDTYYIENSLDNIKSSFYDCYLNENGDKIISKYYPQYLPDVTLKYSSNNNTIYRFIFEFAGSTERYDFDPRKVVIAGTFTELYNLIKYGSFYVNLKQNYTFDEYVDYDLVDGIDVASRQIYGNGFTIDGSNQARIFNVHYYTAFHDINFVNAISDNGGAIIGTSDSGFVVSNSNFTNNHATISGGAMYNGRAVNCNFINNAADCGGAIYRGAAENCTFVNNVAHDGGAIYDVYAVNSTFINNFAINSYGAMYNNSAVNCTFIKNSANNNSGAVGFGYTLNCTFIDNYALQAGALGYGHADSCIFESNYANDGGAMFSGDAINCIFIGNYANQGGAISCKVQASNCTFEYNHAIENGGAILDSYAERCNFSGNYANNGGAIYDGLGALYCNFINNSASEYGGALYRTYANNCNFELNTAKFGGAISNASVSNSTFVNNTAEVSGGNKFDSYVFNCTYNGKLPKYTLYSPDFTAIEGFGGNINVKMYDSPNYYLDGEDIIVKIYNSDNTLVRSYNAQTGYNIFIDLGAGQYKAVISGGNNGHEVNSINITITIKKSTFIYAVNVTTTYKEDNYLIVNLQSTNNKFINNETVSVTIDGVTKDFTTDDRGQVKVPTSGLAPKTYTATITFAGNDEYEKSTAAAMVVVNKIKVSLSSAGINVVYNDDNCLVANLKDIYGNPLNGVNVTAVFSNGKTDAQTTDKNGQVKFSTDGLAPKTYTATITFAGNDEYEKSTAAAMVVVNKIKVSLSLADMNVVYNDGKCLVAYLKDIYGNPLNGVKVTAVFSNGKTDAQTTDKNGQVKFSTNGLAPKTYSATITFAGNTNYDKSNKIVNVKVTKATPILSAPKKTFKKSVSPKKYTVTLKDNAKKAMSKKSIKLSVNKKTYIVKTNSKGQATFKITNLKKKGTFKATVKYAGDLYYNSKSVTAKITVK